MKYGIIDIGTNSMRLLLTNYEEGQFKNRKKIINTTRLGKGLDQSGNISKESIQRNISALEEFKKICTEEKCQEIFCMGTEALRKAKNSDVFVEKARTELGLDVEIINGEKEAQLGYLGVMGGLPKQDSNILVIDIGGGSTEFIIGDDKAIKFKKSLDIGALVLSDRYIREYPVDDSTLEAIDNELEDKLENIISDLVEYGELSVVGIGGTITSVSAIQQELEQYSMDKIHMSKINRNNLISQIDKIKGMDLEEIRLLKGLQKKRAEIILCGELILEKIITKLDKFELLVSEYDNLEGYIKYIENN